MSKKVTVTVVPLSGAPVNHEVECPENGMTVKQALAAAGVSGDKKNLEIRREADSSSKVHGGETVVVITREETVKRGDRVSAEERPAGS